MDELSKGQWAKINPGIRHTVKVLRDWGFNTTDSGDGQTHEFECDLPYPYVHIVVNPSRALVGEARRLVDLLVDNAGIDFNNPHHPQDHPEEFLKWPRIECTYLPIEDVAIISLMNVMLKPS